MADDQYSANVIIGGQDQLSSVLNQASTSVTNFVNNASRALQTQAQQVAQTQQNIQRTAQQTQNTLQQTSTAVTSMTGAITGAVKGMAAEFLTADAVIKFAEKSLHNFADQQDGMLRVQQATGATTEEMRKLGTELNNLERTGSAAMRELRESFEDFQEMNRLTADQAQKEFPKIVQAAQVAGTQVDSMVKLWTAAAHNLKVPLEEIPDVIDGWLKTIPSSMMGAFSAAIPRLTADLNLIGLNGKQSAFEIGAAYKELAISLGNPTTALRNMEQLINTIAHGSSPQLTMALRDSQAAGEGFAGLLERIYAIIPDDAWDDAAQMGRVAKQLHIPPAVIRSLKEWHDQFTAMNKDVEEAENARGTRAQRFAEIQKTLLAGMQDFMASFSQFSTEVGRTLEDLGASDALHHVADILHSLQTSLEQINNIMEGKPFDWAHLLGIDDLDAKVARMEAQLARLRAAASSGDINIGPGGITLGNPEKQKAAAEAVERADEARRAANRASNRPEDEGTYAEQRRQDKEREERLDAQAKELREREKSQSRPWYLPHHADGAIVDKPEVAMIGEAGPEAIIPLQGSGDRQAAEAVLSGQADSSMWNRIQSLIMRQRQTKNIGLSDADMAALNARAGGGGGGGGGGGFAGGGGSSGGGGASGTWTTSTDATTNAADGEHSLKQWPGDTASPASAAPGGYGPYTGWPTLDEQGRVVAGGTGAVVGSAATNAAIEEAAKKYGLDPVAMKAYARIESNFTPDSNRNRSTQYKGLFQLGASEFSQYRDPSVPGDVYDARANAAAAARYMADNAGKFKAKFGRDPTAAEIYMMHQQGLGFYTRGALTNPGGNPYPGMSGPQSHASFEQGWSNRVNSLMAEYGKGGTSGGPVSPAHGVVTTTGIPKLADGGVVSGPAGQFVDARSIAGKPVPAEVQQAAENSGIPSAFVKDLQAMTLNGGNPHDMSAWMRSKGINLGVATCGQFMAAVVQAHGGTPPRGAPTAANWDQWPEGYSNDPNAINIATWNRQKNLDTGGSHVTGVTGVTRDKNGNIVSAQGTGANQGEGRGVVSTHSVPIGPGTQQFTIHHQIVKPSGTTPSSVPPAVSAAVAPTPTGLPAAVKAADGATIDGPTLALMGEGTYPEARIPLGGQHNLFGLPAAGDRADLEKRSEAAQRTWGLVSKVAGGPTRAAWDIGKEVAKTAWDYAGNPGKEIPGEFVEAFKRSGGGLEPGTYDYASGGAPPGNQLGRAAGLNDIDGMRAKLSAPIRLNVEAPNLAPARRSFARQEARRQTESRTRDDRWRHHGDIGYQ